MYSWVGEPQVQPIRQEHNDTTIYLYVNRPRSDGKLIVSRQPLEDKAVLEKGREDVRAYLEHKAQVVVDHLDTFLDENCDCSWPLVNRLDICPVHGR